MKIAVVGATGLVGSVMNKVLEEFDLPIETYMPVASERSVGKSVSFKGTEYKIISMQDAIAARPDIAIFSAGGQTSLDWAPKFADAGCTVIDNSSAWRMDPTKKLVVPEINASNLTKEDKIIANPNCSTIQLVMALWPLHEAYQIKRVVVSTYQSFTGTGVKALKQYEAEKQNIALTKEEMAYHYPIFANCIPQCDVFLDNKYTKEEMKLVNETQKIMNDPSIKVTATAVRVPVDGGHSESVNVEFSKPYNLDDVYNLFGKTSGITLKDDIKQHSYPMPLYAKDKNDVFIGRVRRDESIENGLNMWIVADNLRKGAATNAVQIAKYLINHNLV
ncbi:MAG: aspartate-semialdehyde dehydrogenase [Saprospiraceae bacterium]